MNDLTRPTGSRIEQCIGAASFHRRVRHYRQRRIFNPRRQVETLKALCSGSQPEPCRAEIRLGLEGIVKDDHLSHKPNQRAAVALVGLQGYRSFACTRKPWPS